MALGVHQSSKIARFHSYEDAITDNITTPLSSARTGKTFPKSSSTRENTLDRTSAGRPSREPGMTGLQERQLPAGLTPGSLFPNFWSRVRRPLFAVSRSMGSLSLSRR